MGVSYSNYGYGNFPMGYPSQFNSPPVQSVPPVPQQAQTQGGGFIPVDGENQALAYPVAPGSSVLLMDRNVQTFYLKSVDASGMPNPLRIFDFRERVPQTAKSSAPQAAAPDLSAFVTREELDRHIEQRLTALLSAANGGNGGNGGNSNESAG